MNAFALHDTSDHAGVLRWGTSAACDRCRACRADRAGHELVHAAAAAGRHAAGDHGGHGAGDLGAAADASWISRRGPSMQQADASPPEPAKQQETVEEQIAPTPPQQKPEVVAPPEQKAEPTPPKPSRPRSVPDAKPTPVKPKVGPRAKPRSRPRRRRRRAPRRRPAPNGRRRPPPRSAPAQRRRRSRPTSSASRAHLQRFKQYPSAAKAASRASRRSVFTLSRGGQVMSEAASADRRASRRSTPRRWRWSAAPSRFPRFRLKSKQASMSFSDPGGVYGSIARDPGKVGSSAPGRAAKQHQQKSQQRGGRQAERPVDADRAPSRPTVMPLKARMPSPAMLNRPMTRPRMAAGAFNCTSVCAIVLNDNSKNPATNSSSDRERVNPDRREGEQATAPTAWRAEGGARRSPAAVPGSPARCRRAARRRRRRPAARCRRRRDRHARDRWRSPASAPGRRCRSRGRPPASSVIEVSTGYVPMCADGLHDVGKAADRAALSATAPLRAAVGAPNSQSSIGR